MSSRNNFEIENNKRLFESRLQINTNSNSSNIKINKISIKNKKNDSSNISFLNNSQLYTKLILYERIKDQSLLNNSSINNNNNSLVHKKIIKIKKNRNKNQNKTISTSLNKSNILLKDITLFQLLNSKKENENQNNTIIKTNKRMTKQNSNNRSLNRKYKKDIITINIKKPTKKTKKDINSFNTKAKRMIMINDTNSYMKEYENICKNNKINNKLINKDKFIPKFKLRNYKFKNSRNSSMEKSRKNNDSFLIKKIKLKYEKKSKLNSNNNTNDNIFLGDFSNIRGRNIKNNKKRGMDINNGNKGHTQRTYFTGKNYGILYKLTNDNMKYDSSLDKNDNIFNYDTKGYKTNNNINNKNNNLNKLLKEKNKNISRNYKINNNKKNTYNKFNVNSGIQGIIALNESKKKSNDNYDKFNKNDIKNFNCEEKKKFINKEENFDDNNNGTSTKTNDEFFSEKKDKKVNDTSLKEESGFLSINEIEDIIYYNDMKDINKEDNFLFKLDDMNNFIKQYKNKIYNLFFDNNCFETHKPSKIKIKKNNSYKNKF